MNNENLNPLLQKWDTHFGTPPFHLIKTSHFKEAAEKAVAMAASEIDSIADNGYNPGRCESDWRDAGVIVCDPGRFTYQAYHKGDKIRCIRFREETMNDIVCKESYSSDNTILSGKISRKIRSSISPLLLFSMIQERK